MKKSVWLQWFAWLLAIVSVGVAVFVWYGQRFGKEPLSLLDIFPVLGLTAFSLMWTHYIVGAVRRLLRQDKTVIKSYMAVTSWLVLVLILLHPGLLWYQLWQSGLGLPPSSYLHAYPGTPAHIAMMLGSIALVTFLAFECKRAFGTKKWWKYVEFAQIIAMFAIFYHGLKLGGELQVSWFRMLWLFYGVSLVGAVLYSYLYQGNMEEKAINE